MQNQKLVEADDDNRVAPKALTISQVAQITGVKAKAIRCYESIGLLPSPPRGSNQYRRYFMSDVNRLILLRRIRYLGVPLSTAKSLLMGASDARCVDIQNELLQLVKVRLGELDREITELHLLRDEMEHYQRKLEHCHPDESEPFRTCIDMSCIALPEETVKERNYQHDRL
jgi:MerR family transcriptional regulator, copper efflux regulator